eukprot:m.9152 g.9152  ORF g.9152 m.9152 type:complete len:161 (+) comp5409_c0_seq1:57-539(+)
MSNDISTPPTKPQTLKEMYSEPENVLEIDVINPQTHGFGRTRYTDYEIRMKTNLPIFRLKESQVRRRYSDFVWLRDELERESKIMVPAMPGKAWKRQLPWVSDKDSIFSDAFIEERRAGLEDFINKVTGHPLAQNEKALHIFLQEPQIDKNYTPGKVRPR